MKLETTLRLIKENISELHKFGVKTLAVFGSTVRREALPDSDIDLLVTFHAPPTFDQYIETKFFLEDLLGCQVDFVIQDGLRPLVRSEVEKEAIYVA
jgi:predicted nucleotidyltransferase